MSNKTKICHNQRKNYLIIFFSGLLFLLHVLSFEAAHSMALKPFVDISDEEIQSLVAVDKSEDDSSRIKDRSSSPSRSSQVSSANLQESLREVIPLWSTGQLRKNEWTEHVRREIERNGHSLLSVEPQDARTWCRNYRNLSKGQKIDYWTFFISSMSKFESGFDPQEAFREGFKDSRGQRVVSRGLLQLSLESARNYGCSLTRAQDLHDPYKNLSCGVKILNHWMQRDRRIASKALGQWRGGARYWSVLRAGPKESYRSINQWSNKLSICSR